MPVQITIIGMGQIGTSVGLALAAHRDLVLRVGHDLDVKNSRLAEKMGALDRVALNLRNSVNGADIVILSLPADQIRETLELISEELKDNAVIMDTAPVKEVTAKWAKELLLARQPYVGLAPVLNPVYLQTHESGVGAAHADLFRGGMMWIVAPPGTPSEAVKLAADLSRLLGAQTLFADPVEVDSLMAATHILPQLIAAALTNITVDQPGWREGRKLAGRAYAEVTGSVAQFGEPGGLSSSALLSSEHVIRSIDGMIAALQGFRSDLKSQNAKDLQERIERARKGRERWWIERQAANWAAEEAAPVAEAPSASEVFGRLLGMGGRKQKN